MAQTLDLMSDGIGAALGAVHDYTRISAQSFEEAMRISDRVAVEAAIDPERFPKFCSSPPAEAAPVAALLAETSPSSSMVTAKLATSRISATAVSAHTSEEIAKACPCCGEQSGCSAANEVFSTKADDLSAWWPTHEYASSALYSAACAGVGTAIWLAGRPEWQPSHHPEKASAYRVGPDIDGTEDDVRELGFFPGTPVVDGSSDGIGKSSLSLSLKVPVAL